MGGNICCPRDVNGNIFGDTCMKWWFEVVGSCSILEVCDDLLANSQEVVGTVKALGREKEINARREKSASSNVTTLRARPKSARRRKLVAKDGAPITTTTPRENGNSENNGRKEGVPLVKPPLAHSNRDRMTTQLEPIDDIQAKFSEIKNRLGKAKSLCRVDGALPVLKQKKSTSKRRMDLDKVEAEDFSKLDFGGEEEEEEEEEEEKEEDGGKEEEELTATRPNATRRFGQSRFEAVSEKNNKVAPKSKLGQALDFDDTYNKEVKEEIMEDKKEQKQRSSSSSSLSLSSSSSSSSSIKNLIKNANDRVKQAQAYSGSKKSHLQFTEKKKAKTKPPPRAAAKAAEVLIINNDANEFHPEFEHYEGAAFDDEFDVGFESKATNSPEKSSAMKLFNLDEFDSSSEDEDMHGGRIGIAPPTREVDAGPVDINPFFPEKTVSIKKNPPTLSDTEAMDSRRRLLQKALNNEEEEQEEEKMKKIANDLENFNVSDEVMAMLGGKLNEENNDASASASASASELPRFEATSSVSTVKPAQKNRTAPTQNKKKVGLGGSRGFKMPRKKNTLPTTAID